MNHPDRLSVPVFSLLLFFAFSSTEAKTVNIGNGSGTLEVTSMKDLKKGDTLLITKGTYSGGTFSNLHDITIVPEDKAVTFTGPIIIGHDNKVTFDGLSPDKPVNPNIDPGSESKSLYGFTFSGFDGTAFVPSGNNQNVTIQGALFSNIKCVIEGAAPTENGKPLTYNGHPDTALFYKLTLDTIKITGKTALYNGTWDPPASYHNVNIGMTLRNGIYVNDGTQVNNKFFGNSIYKMLVENWRITGPTINKFDCGIFVVYGNATLRNIYRNGGWGYLLRIWNVGLGEPGESYVYNCIDVNSTHYGTIDCRVDPANLAPHGSIPVLGGNMHIYNVTSGDKGDVTHDYITNLLVLGEMTDGKKVFNVEIKNCIAFNAFPGKNGSLIQYNCDQKKSTVDVTQSNNIDITGPLPDGYFVDKEKFYPAKDGPLVGKGVVLPMVKTDLYGNPRGDTNDIGAVQHR